MRENGPQQVTPTCMHASLFVRVMGGRRGEGERERNAQLYSRKKAARSRSSSLSIDKGRFPRVGNLTWSTHACYMCSIFLSLFSGLGASTQTWINVLWKGRFTSSHLTQSTCTRSSTFILSRLKQFDWDVTLDSQMHITWWIPGTNACTWFVAVGKLLPHCSIFATT